MALIVCPECKNIISDTALSCPHCGYPMTKENTESSSIENPTQSDFIVCPYCNGRISKYAKTCPYCNKDIPSEKIEDPSNKSDRTTNNIAIGCVSAVLILIGFLVFRQSNNLGCSQQNPQTNVAEDNQIKENKTRIKEIQDIISSNETHKWQDINVHVKFVNELIEAVNSGAERKENYTVNLDSLVTELGELTVEITDVTIVRDWLTEEEISRSETSRTMLYQTGEKPETEYIEKASNYSEKRAKSLKEEYPYWDKEECMYIIQKKIWIGMSETQLIKSWGRPKDINRTVGSWGSHEQWIYGDLGPYIYVLNGRVTSWQD